MTSRERSVAVCIVTHNSAADISQCLDSLTHLDYRPLTVVVVDCASSDESVALVNRWDSKGVHVQLIALDANLGFSGGMNVAIGRTAAPYVLVLNPDARPNSDFVTRLVNRIESRPQTRPGAVTGRLMRPTQQGSQRIDACGMYLTATWRHLDRGSGEVERGQWNVPERVFGATAAATLFVREALDDTALHGDFFAEEFHTYREDAELCFRLRERNWDVLYEPQAICEHLRTNLPRRRRRMPPEINYHSLKNRYLLRAYHQDGTNFLLTCLPTIWRDLLALLYVVFTERTSFAAYTWLWQQRRFIRRRRRLIRERRTSTAWDINRWFFRRSLPL